MNSWVVTCDILGEAGGTLSENGMGAASVPLGASILPLKKTKRKTRNQTKETIQVKKIQESIWIGKLTSHM